MPPGVAALWAAVEPEFVREEVSALEESAPGEAAVEVLAPAAARDPDARWPVDAAWAAVRPSPWGC